MDSSRVESIEDARKEYKLLLEEGGSRKVYLKAIFKKVFNWGFHY